MANLMRFTQRAGQGHAYAPGAFDRIAGRDIRLTVEGRGTGTARVVAVRVTPGGASAVVTVELPAWVRDETMSERECVSFSDGLVHVHTETERDRSETVSLAAARQERDERDSQRDERDNERDCLALASGESRS